MLYWIAALIVKQTYISFGMFYQNVSASVFVILPGAGAIFQTLFWALIATSPKFIQEQSVHNTLHLGSWYSFTSLHWVLIAFKTKYLQFHIAKWFQNRLSSICRAVDQTKLLVHYSSFLCLSSQWGVVDDSCSKLGNDLVLLTFLMTHDSRGWGIAMFSCRELNRHWIECAPRWNTRVWMVLV